MENVFELLNLKLCESVLLRQAGIFKAAHRDAALDCQSTINELYKQYTATGLTKDIEVGFLMMEQILMELEGNLLRTSEQDRDKVRASFNSRRACHESYQGKGTITKSALRRAAALKKGA